MTQQTTKITESSIPNREKVINTVSTFPGLRFFELKKQTDLPNGTLQHHVNSLVKSKQIRAHYDNAVPRYFRDIPKSKPVDLSKFTMPILYIHGEHDPRQPIEYCYDMEKFLPGLEAILVLDAGHFVTRERPIETTNAMMWFFNSMLGSGLKIFEHSKKYGLPTKPVKETKEKFGVNALKS